MKQLNLFGNEMPTIARANNRKQKTLTNYDKFVEKFEQKKTTDDCYTPIEVYKIIIKFVSENFDLSGYEIIRPFFPGGNYESIEYKENNVVIDNPPFSIVSKIAKFYIQRNIKFFLFAPHMTLFSADLECSRIVCGTDIVYENGAIVKTSFLSNMHGNNIVIGVPDLYAELKRLKKNKVELPKYQYPKNVLTVSNVQKFVESGIRFSVDKKDAKHCRSLDCQKIQKKTLFGSGFLLSDKAAADKAAADKAAADKAAADMINVIKWELSDDEMKIVQNLGRVEL